MIFTIFPFLNSQLFILKKINTKSKRHLTLHTYKFVLIYFCMCIYFGILPSLYVSAYSLHTPVRVTTPMDDVYPFTCVVRIYVCPVYLHGSKLLLPHIKYEDQSLRWQNLYGSVIWFYQCLMYYLRTGFI